MAPPKLDARGAQLAKVRDALWPGKESEVFSGVGFAQIPRTVGLIASLIDRLASKAAPGRVYLTLWLNDRRAGCIEVSDPAAFAYETGYRGQRARRTWTERINVLVSLGFIEVSGTKHNEHRFVRLRDPHRVVMELKSAGRIDDDWWNTFPRSLHRGGDRSDRLSRR